MKTVKEDDGIPDNVKISPSGIILYGIPWVGKVQNRNENTKKEAL